MPIKGQTQWTEAYNDQGLIGHVKRMRKKNLIVQKMSVGEQAGLIGRTVGKAHNLTKKVMETQRGIHSSLTMLSRKTSVDRMMRNVMRLPIKGGRGMFGMRSVAKFIGTHPGFAAAAIGLTAAGMGVTKQVFKTVSFAPPERPSSLRAGPGYISWGKTSGMPSNNLSTDGLGLALSNLRHTSTI